MKSMAVEEKEPVFFRDEFSDLLSKLKWLYVYLCIYGYAYVSY